LLGIATRFSRKLVRDAFQNLVTSKGVKVIDWLIRYYLQHGKCHLTSVLSNDTDGPPVISGQKPTVKRWFQSNHRSDSIMSVVAPTVFGVTS
jgi:hypothetical protein